MNVVLFLFVYISGATDVRINFSFCYWHLCLYTLPRLAFSFAFVSTTIFDISVQRLGSMKRLMHTKQVQK